MYGDAAADDAQVADVLHERLVTFLAPLLRSLDAQIDRRLVRTCSGAVEAIVRAREAGLGDRKRPPQP